MDRTSYSIYELLGNYRETYKSNRDMGTAFERLMKAFFINDPQYAAIFDNVWMWSEWPEKWGPDCGIDLVARSHAGQYTAVQCKFYDDTYQIEKSDIDSFFTESGRTFKVGGVKHKFSGRIIVSTTSLWSENADRSIRDQDVDTIRIGLDVLSQSPIDWSKFNIEKPDAVPLKPKK